MRVYWWKQLIQLLWVNMICLQKKLYCVYFQSYAKRQVEHMEPMITAAPLALTHWGRDKTDDISAPFSWMKIFEFRLKFQWNFFHITINIILALVQIMAWRRSGEKPIDELMMVSLLTHICVTRLPWINTLNPRQNGCNFVGDIFKFIFVNGNYCILIKSHWSLFLRA